MSYEINRYGNGVLVTMHGKVTLDHINEANNSIYTQDDFTDHTFQIFNLLDADMHSIVPIDISKAALDDKMQSIFKKQYQVALVATEQHAIQICIEYQNISNLYNSNWVIKIFSTLEEAKRWVGLNT